mmetsp:Transcript_2111/g.5698  ORF Transcript_2111/g.5698 Transcript_2111/m.5698 type:complete len:272 (-) Transcript_2111:70-885(-)
MDGDESEGSARGRGRQRSSKGVEKDWRRAVLRVGFCAGVGLVALYEYALRFPQDEPLHPLDALDSEMAEDELHGMTFAKELAAAKAERELDYSLEDVREEYKDKYSDKARSLLCSACKLTAASVGEQLSARNVSGQPNPASLLSATKQAVLAACDELPEPLVVAGAGSKRGASFLVYEASQHGDVHLSGVEMRKSEVARRSAQRLCRVVLDDARLSMVELLIRHKVPHHRHSGPGQALNDSWERWLCARRARLCKRYEVEEDDEEEEEGEL